MFYGVLREFFEINEMSLSQSLSVISLIHKKGEKDLLKNYKPIS